MNITFESNFVVFPHHTNYMPPMIFGGKLASEMDICAAMTVRRCLYSSETCVDAVTVAINKVNFYKAAKIKDLIHLKGTIIKLGIKSLTILVQGSVEYPDGNSDTLCDGEFIFVSRNQDGVPFPHGLTL